MVKALDSPYQAGRRGATWRKVKPVHTLDLVVLAAEWGHGRRTGWLSNLHLGARGPDGTFVMVGKTFKGLTDELLRWQTDELQARRSAARRPATSSTSGRSWWWRSRSTACSAATRYPGGVALRFARVRRYRPDKSAARGRHDRTGAVDALIERAVAGRVGPRHGNAALQLRHDGLGEEHDGPPDPPQSRQPRPVRVAAHHARP